MLVTGANGGLGFLTCLELARHGARVIMTARDLEKGRDAQARILAIGPKGSIDLRQLDLADLDQVKAFGEQLIGERKHVDVLVNNARIMMPPHSLTRQGHELQFGVNHLAHFALTGLLLPQLLASRDGRVVTISSDLHKRGRIRFDDLTGSRRYGRVAFYAQSKFANVLFALELDRRLKAAGAPLKSVLAHPGYAATNLQLSGPSGILKLFLRFGNRFLAQAAEMGVLPQLYASTAPEVEGSQFIGPNSKNEKKGYPIRVQPVEAAQDTELARGGSGNSRKISPAFAPTSRTQRGSSHDNAQHPLVLPRLDVEPVARGRDAGQDFCRTTPFHELSAHPIVGVDHKQERRMTALSLAHASSANLIRAAASSIVVLALTSIHHLYGAVVYETPWRMHVMYVSIPGAILIAGFLLIAWQFRGTSRGRMAAWFGVALAFPVGIIGIYEGGYNHLLKNLLYFGGATDLVSQLFPSPAYELPNDAFFELTGITQFVAGLVAGRYVLRLSRLREHVHAT